MVSRYPDVCKQMRNNSNQTTWSHGVQILWQPTGCTSATVVHHHVEHVARLDAVRTQTKQISGAFVAFTWLYFARNNQESITY